MMDNKKRTIALIPRWIPIMILMCGIGMYCLPLLSDWKLNVTAWGALGWASLVIVLFLFSSLRFEEAKHENA